MSFSRRAFFEGLMDGFVAENDGRVRFEDPLDIYRGYYGRMPEDQAQ